VALLVAGGAACSSGDPTALAPVATDRAAESPPAVTPGTASRGGPATGPVRTAPPATALPDDATAERAVLRAADLPGGWDEVDHAPVPALDPEPSTCRSGDDALARALAVTDGVPGARSPAMVTAGGARSVEHDVAVLADDGQAAEVMAGVRGPAFADCVRRIVATEAGRVPDSPYDPEGVTVEALPVSTPDLDLVNLHVTLPSRDGHRAHILASFARMGRVLSTLTFFSAEGFDTVDYEPLVARALDRVRTAAT
jgi:hypothetical protein